MSAGNEELERLLGEYQFMRQSEFCARIRELFEQAWAASQSVKQREADYRAVIAAIRRVADGYRAPLAAQVVNECAEAADRAWSGGGDAHAAESNVRSGLHAVTGAAHPPNAGNEELEQLLDQLWDQNDAKTRVAIRALFAEREAQVAALHAVLMKLKWAAAPEQNNGTSRYPYEEIQRIDGEHMFGVVAREHDARVRAEVVGEMRHRVEQCYAHSGVFGLQGTLDAIRAELAQAARAGGNKT